MARKYLMLLFIVLTACNGKKGGDGHINFNERAPIQPRDAKTQGYFDNKYFVPNVIRLNEKVKGAFIFVDTLYVKPPELLDKNNRESYYKQTLAALPISDLQVHRIIWALPEVAKLQIADGGYSTIVTMIMKRPGETKGQYIVELRRNNIDELAHEKGISSFAVKLHPLDIQVANESGYFVSLRDWRSGRK